MFKPNFCETKQFVDVQVVSFRDATESELEDLGNESDEFDDDSFELELNAISSRKEKKQMVEVKLSNTKSPLVKVFTRKFVWPFPWLIFTIAYDLKSPVNSLKKNKFVVTTVKLNDSRRVKYIRCFLKSLHMHDTATAQGFKNHCKTLKNPKLTRIRKHMNSFLKRYPNDKDAVHFIKQLKAFMLSKKAGKVLSLALDAPHFFRHGPLLFSKKISNMILDDSPRGIPNYIKILNKIIAEEPMTLSYSTLLDASLEKTCGLEVGLVNMKMAEFYDIGLSPLNKDCLHVYNAIKHVCIDQGHFYLTEEDIFESKYLKEEVSLSEYWPDRKPFPHYPPDSSRKRILDFLCRNKVLKMEEVENESDKRYFLMKYYNVEQNIRSKISRLLRSGNRKTIKIDFSSDEFAGIRNDPEQMQAVKLCAERPVVMVTGRGGTGKTEVVSAVIKKMVKERNQPLKLSSGESVEDSCSDYDDDEEEEVESPFILCVAPTGKAVAGMTKRCEMQAYTIHSIIASYKTFSKSCSTDSWPFSQVEVLAIDETSMVSPELLSTLLNCLLVEAPLKKIIFLGDVDQLPSIQPGNLMENLHGVLNKLGNVIHLKTNHRSEGHLIFENAERIRNREMPLFDDSSVFRMIPVTYSEADMELRPITPKTDQFKIQGSYKFSNYKKELYQRLMANHRREFGLDDPRNSQMIAFTNNEGQFFNEIATQAYNNHLVLEPKSIKDGRLELQFFVNDKIMATRNSDINSFIPTVVIGSGFSKKVPPPPAKQCEYFFSSKTYRISNGSVFFIMQVVHSDQGMKVFKLDDLKGKTIFVDSKEFISRCKPTHAYGCTIHKFQGSESDHVLYGLSTSEYESWRHVYTAVTRAKKSITIIGNENSLYLAMKNNPPERQTMLEERFADDLEKLMLISTEPDRKSAFKHLKRKRSHANAKEESNDCSCLKKLSIKKR